tara:strand:- start:1826 stop:2053 length:228 start_codon:yes stop_codon:yes gene_type:complete
VAFLEQRTIGCPYCGESISILIEPSEGATVGDEYIETIEPYEYIEDCQVCCRPIRMQISVDYTGETQANVFSEND